MLHVKKPSLSRVLLVMSRLPQWHLLPLKKPELGGTDSASLESL